MGIPKSFSIATATAAGMDGTRCCSVIKQHALKVSQGTYFVVYPKHPAVPHDGALKQGQSQSADRNPSFHLDNPED
ncbi:hypothetical protein D3C86_2138980 [compost metagenome]